MHVSPFAGSHSMSGYNAAHACATTLQQAGRAHLVAIHAVCYYVNVYSYACCT
jgi:hypothetical protein